ncbi:hypothetical protein HPB49_005144 [Dermacentor silvarum]|uniref:Uncharacterized protein n=1 Tax=Dermacentor silvarum TaxID=543639 RepID=A0ACB8DVD3_DERSI|nr:hypothetical protein HPB49_005144 [Dermacentor silvarum]
MSREITHREGGSGVRLVRGSSTQRTTRGPRLLCREHVSSEHPRRMPCTPVRAYCGAVGSACSGPGAAHAVPVYRNGQRASNLFGDRASISLEPD